MCLMISILAFYSDNLSLNPGEVYSVYVWKEQKEDGDKSLEWLILLAGKT